MRQPLSIISASERRSCLIRAYYLRNRYQATRPYRLSSPSCAARLPTRQASRQRTTEFARAPCATLGHQTCGSTLCLAQHSLVFERNAPRGDRLAPSFTNIYLTGMLAAAPTPGDDAKGVLKR